MAAVHVKPLGDRVLVQPIEEQETKKGGIIIPDTAKEKPQEGKVVAEVLPGSKGWPWLAVEFPLIPAPLPKGEREKSGGRLIVCGFAIIGAWEASPTPRYLLARILEQFEE